MKCKVFLPCRDRTPQRDHELPAQPCGGARPGVALHRAAVPAAAVLHQAEQHRAVSGCAEDTEAHLGFYVTHQHHRPHGTDPQRPAAVLQRGPACGLVRETGPTQVWSCDDHVMQ